MKDLGYSSPLSTRPQSQSFGWAKKEAAAPLNPLHNYSYPTTGCAWENGKSLTGMLEQLYTGLV